MMTYTEAVSYVNSTNWKNESRGLLRMRSLMAALHNPEKKVRYVHIAGTNGKGSCAAMLSTIFQAAGYKTGLYTSPHLVRENERMQIDGIPVPDDRFALLAEEVKHAADGIGVHPTEFETLTAMAFLYFAEEKVEIAALEVGLGGRLDATNVLPNPALCVIMNIGLEHTEILGDTLEKIAGEKAGIIKDHIPVVCHPGMPGVMEVFRQVAAEHDAPLTAVDFSSLHTESLGLSGQVLNWRDLSDVRLPLIGEHQAGNAAVAIEASRKLDISDQAIRQGLERVSWPGRFEVLSKDPVFIADGAHNPQCARTLAAALDTVFLGQKVEFLLGVLQDKDYQEMMDLLLPYAKGVVLLKPDSPRALDPDILAKYLRGHGAKVRVAKSVTQALDLGFALADGTPLVLTGSLYLLGEVRKGYLTSYKGREHGND